jgi:hypothetical protein
MTNPLKAAVRGMLNEFCVYGTSAGDNQVDAVASALARRGVVVVAEEQNDALMYLRAARDAYFDGNAHDGSEQSPEGYLYAAIERVLSLGALVRNVAGDSPAPKPARKVVHFAEDDAGITALCNDGSFWRWHRRSDHWRLCDMTRIPEFDLPHVGGEK